MTIFVPVLIAVDTDREDVARECAKVVCENTMGESFSMQDMPDAPVAIDASSVVVL